MTCTTPYSYLIVVINWILLSGTSVGLYSKKVPSYRDEGKAGGTVSVSASVNRIDLHLQARAVPPISLSRCVQCTSSCTLLSKQVHQQNPCFQPRAQKQSSFRAVLHAHKVMRKCYGKETGSPGPTLQTAADFQDTHKCFPLCGLQWA